MKCAERMVTSCNTWQEVAIVLVIVGERREWRSYERVRERDKAKKTPVKKLMAARARIRDRRWVWDVEL